MLAGGNDVELLTRSGVGRDINRHYYQPGELDDALTRPVVQQLFELIRLRNEHPAFAGSFELDQPSTTRLRLAWTNGGHRLQLDVDFAQPAARIVEGDSEAPLMSWSADTA